MRGEREGRVVRVELSEWKRTACMGPSTKGAREGQRIVVRWGTSRVQKLNTKRPHHRGLWQRRMRRSRSSVYSSKVGGTVGIQC